MKIRRAWVLGWLGFSVAAWADAYPLSLFEFAPQVTWVQQTYPINGGPVAFSSKGNLGGTFRFTPIWRGKYPLFFHFGGQRLVEENTSGITVVGEHMNEKYLWTFGARMGFYPLETRRLLSHVGFEFNHDAFIRDLGGSTGHLNKVLFPTLALGTSVEWFKMEGFSATADLGLKVDFSVPMDVWLARNGMLVYARCGAHWIYDGFRLFTQLSVEPHWLNTTLGDASRTSVALEIGVGWGSGD